MKRVFLTIVLVLLVANLATAASIYWRNVDGTTCGGQAAGWPDQGIPFAVDDDWANSNNWTGGWSQGTDGVWRPNPALPTAADDAILNREALATVGTGDAAVAAKVYVGKDWGGKLDVTGGSLTVGGDTIVGFCRTNNYSYKNVMNVSGGTVSISTDLVVGDGGLPQWVHTNVANAAGTGYLNVTGGSTTVAGLILGRTQTYDTRVQTGVGKVSIYSGTLQAGTLTVGSTSFIKVRGDGLLILASNQVAAWNTLVGAGLASGVATFMTSGPYVGKTVVSVPEPATLCLLGLGGLVFFRRKKH